MKAWFSILLAGLGAAASLTAFSMTRDWKVLALCSLVTILALEELRMIYRRAARVERLIQERTQELSRTNAQLEEDRRRITAQYVVTKALAESQNLHDAAQKILEQVCETLGWEVGTVWSMDRAANALRCEEFWSAPSREVTRFEEATRKSTLPPGLGLPGRVWASQRPAWIPDVTKDNNFPRAGAAEQSGLYAAFAFPIRLRGEVLGVVEFFNDEITQPDEPLLNMMDSIGSQMGQFIERKRLEKLKDEFVSTVSHELRTPLSITKEGISLVLDRIPGEINPEQEEILTTARGNIDRLARIINDLLDISKLETGRIHLRRERVEIGDLFRQVAGAFEPRASAKGLSLRVSVPEQGVPIYADPDKTMEILTNLVDNAMKFTDAGQITLSARPGGEEVECAVEDTGTGISAEDLPRVFGKFEQFGRVSGAGARGTGLGLAIVKHLVELHQGTLRVESELKKGTRFVFTLPCYSPVNVLRGLVEDRVHEAAIKGSRLSVLRMKFPPEKTSGLDDLEAVFRRRACRPGDQVVQLPGELTLVLADCDQEAVFRVRERCERLLRAALSKKGLVGEGHVHCGEATFPEEAQTAEELLVRAEERCNRPDAPAHRMAG
ncbi:MAG: GAF domain-containing sensor histidine kinase [Candidatus Omnitrophota bacterium]|nr:GAF domain-containing sensor histidine kinase [Candidatus Omnitrophota bacterium]